MLPLRHWLKHHGARGVGHVTRRETVSLVGGHEKIGVVHAERIEDALLQELFERHAADLADEIADDIGGDGIIPGLAGRKFQRHFGKIVDHRLQRAGFLDLADFQLAVGGVDIGRCWKP